MIDHFRNVKQIGPRRWKACCPAHDDKNPSLVITELEDKYLVKCWSGCSARDIMESAGLRYGDLFKTELDLSQRKKYVSEQEKLKASTWLAVARAELRRGGKLTPEESRKAEECYQICKS